MILAPVKLAYPSQIFDLHFLLFKGFVLWTILSFHFWNFLNRIFRVALLFICQGSACSCLTQLHYFIIRFEVCQEFFEIFLFFTTAASAVGFHINMFFHFCQYVFLIYFYVVSAGRKKRILMLLRFLFYISLFLFSCSPFPYLYHRFHLPISTSTLSAVNS